MERVQAIAKERKETLTAEIETAIKDRAAELFKK
jgi:hypothetical protein